MSADACQILIFVKVGKNCVRVQINFVSVNNISQQRNHFKQAGKIFVAGNFLSGQISPKRNFAASANPMKMPAVNFFALASFSNGVKNFLAWVDAQINFAVQFRVFHKITASNIAANRNQLFLRVLVVVDLENALAQKLINGVDFGNGGVNSLARTLDVGANVNQILGVAVSRH